MRVAKVIVKLLSRFRDLVGKEAIVLDLTEGSTVECLLEKMLDLYGEEFERSIWSEDKNLQVILMLNGKITKLDNKLKNGDIVTLLPPVAGG